MARVFPVCGCILAATMVKSIASRRDEFLLLGPPHTTVKSQVPYRIASSPELVVRQFSERQTMLAYGMLPGPVGKFSANQRV